MLLFQEIFVLEFYLKDSYIPTRFSDNAYEILKHVLDTILDNNKHFTQIVSSYILLSWYISQYGLMVSLLEQVLKRIAEGGLRGP